MNDIIHQGDQYRVYLDYYVNDEPIKNEYSDLELTIGCLLKNGTSQEFKYYFSKGEIIWDEVQEKFYFYLDQDTSFLFNERIGYQLRVCFPNGEVYGSDKECAPIGKTMSKTALDNDGEV